MQQDQTTHVIANEDFAVLFAAEIGTEVELPPLMSGLSDEPVIATVTQVTKKKVVLDITCFGIRLCQRTVTEKEGTFQWE
jgi:hypothetical protein